MRMGNKRFRIYVRECTPCRDKGRRTLFETTNKFGQTCPFCNNSRRKNKEDKIVLGEILR